ncbi:MAG: FMN-binding protein [Sphaerochaeta sp.]|jgi:electron transport complex protein RnfG|uniref:FMN-binding protein n=1 Tax=Sphaerochaeta sp. TaxID=1972642 RepID=UPI002FC5D91C
MTKNLKYAFILLAICAVSAFALALTNSITAPVIAKMDAENRLRALEAVSGGYQIGTQQDVTDQQFVSYTIDLLDSDKVMGYILGLKTAGYGGQMTLVASYSTKGEMLFAQLLSDSETPGLGKRAEQEGYMDKFKGTGADKPVPTSKAMLSSGDAQAVSGSSVTFNGIAKAIAAGSAYVKSLGGAK